MVTARTQKNTAEQSKGNSSRSSLFIAPTQLKKKNENTAEQETPDLFIVPSRAPESQNTVQTQENTETGGTSFIKPTSKATPTAGTVNTQVEEEQKEEKQETQKVEGAEAKAKESAKEAAPKAATEAKPATGTTEKGPAGKGNAKQGGKGGGGGKAGKKGKAQKGGGGGASSAGPNGAQAGMGEKEQAKEEEAPLVLPTENGKAYADGLASQSPINFIRGVKESSTTLAEVQQNEQTTLKDSLPEIEQPTGIPTKSAALKAKAKAASDQAASQIKGDKSELSDLAPTGKAEGENIPEVSEQPASSFAAKLRSMLSWGRSGSDEDRKSQIKSGINNLPTSESVNTDPGEKPEVDLTGQADPTKNTDNLDESTATTDKEQAKNLAESKLYKGEDDIYPEMELEMLAPTVELTEPPSAAALTDEMPTLSAEVQSNFDETAKAQLDADLAPHMEIQNAEYEKMQADQEKERVKSEEEIDAETQRVKQEQETAQSTAKADVDAQRTEWQQENEKVKKEYSEKSEAEKKKVDGDIDTQVKDADTKITSEYDKAKKEADKEVAKTDKEATAKKAEAKKESENKSWWDRAVDAVSSFFDKLKEGLNKLFDGLRSLVKGLIEAAKKLANKLIDLARDAIVGLIKAFGEALKALVNVALAAFPELRDKFNAAIDKAVNAAVEVVNTLAEGLKKAVNALLDALGAVLDAILAAYQAAFNLLLDAMKFLTVGLIKIMKGLANLVSAAIEMPPNFWGQISEEFLGMDVTKPLPFERNTPYSAVGAVDTAATGGTDPVAAYASKGEYAPEDFVVESVPNDMELSKEIMAQVSMLPENGELEFGASNVDTMEHLDMSGQADAAATAGAMDGMAGEAGGVSGDGGGGMVMPPELYGNTTAQIDWFVNKQSAQAPKNIPDSAAGKQPAEQSAIPPAMRVLEPLSIGDRLYYLKTQMMTAIEKKWQENKALYITIGTLVVLAITALAIATGGAIFSLIPPALQIFAALMAGAALLKASGFFGTYMSEGWAGNVAKGGAALARAIGIILVELIFILLFDMSTVLKVLKSGVKGSLKMAVTGTKNTFKALGTGLKASGKGLMKTGSKVVTGIKGIGKGVGKGAKTVDDFAKRMMKKAKFKGFKFKRKGKWFQIYGSVNPWVLLASGKLEEVKTKGGVEIGEHGKFIAKESGEAVDGILVGINKGAGGSNKSKFVKGLEDGTVDVDEFLKIADDAARKKVIKGVDSFNYEEAVKQFGEDAANILKDRGKLAKNIGKEAAGEFDQAHHLIPIELVKRSEIVRKAIEGGFLFNGKINGKWVKQFSSKIDDLKDGIHASHPRYTDRVEDLIKTTLRDVIGKSADDVTKAEAKQVLETVAKAMNDLIDANPTTKLNELVF